MSGGSGRAECRMAERLRAGQEPSAGWSSVGRQGDWARGGWVESEKGVRGGRVVWVVGGVRV